MWVLLFPSFFSLQNIQRYFMCVRHTENCHPFKSTGTENEIWIIYLIEKWWRWNLSDLMTRFFFFCVLTLQTIFLSPYYSIAKWGNWSRISLHNTVTKLFHSQSRSNIFCSSRRKLSWAEKLSVYGTCSLIYQWGASVCPTAFSDRGNRSSKCYWDMKMLSVLFPEKGTWEELAEHWLSPFLLW